MDFKETGCRGCGLDYLPPGRLHWWALVHTAIEILGSIKRLDVF
jgi:hypothetical protein